MEAVHILLWRYGLYDLILIYMLWKRELYKYSVHLVVRVELLYKCKKLLLSCLLWELI